MFYETVTRNASSSDEYWAGHYGRAVILGLLEGDLTAERAAALARMAGSYGRRALAHQEVVREGWAAVGQALGESTPVVGR